MMSIATNPMVYFLPLLLPVTLGLKMIDVLVPRFADLRQSVVLGCSFEVGHGKLYSVKWYKDDNEFYRFIPEDLPAVQVFKQPGITLDLSRCNMRRVTLGNLTFQTSGIYRCEVSTDAPKFEMVFKSANMTVIAYPEGNPLIEGVRSRYAVGDIVSGNCTSFKSYPQPSLTWYINGVQASDRQVEIYPVLVNPEGPLYSKAVGIRFKVEKDHFQGLNVELDLTCEASLVQEQLKWRKMIVIQPLTQTYTDNMLQEEYRNTGNTLTLRKQLSILTGLLITSYLTVCKT